MGTFLVEIELNGPITPKPVVLNALVGTGAAHTAVPEDVLDRIGVPRRTTRHFRQAGGQRVERPLGQALLRISESDEDDGFYVPVIFLPRGADPLLGATALQIFGLAVDPEGERLLPSEALLY